MGQCSINTTEADQGAKSCSEGNNLLTANGKPCSQVEKSVFHSWAILFKFTWQRDRRRPNKCEFIIMSLNNYIYCGHFSNYKRWSTNGFLTRWVEFWDSAVTNSASARKKLLVPSVDYKRQQNDKRRLVKRGIDIINSIYRHDYGNSTLTIKFCLPECCQFFSFIVLWSQLWNLHFPVVIVVITRHRMLSVVHCILYVLLVLGIKILQN